MNREIKDNNYLMRTKLNVYKLRDCIDGNVAFVIADSIKRAYELINEQTTLECVYEDSKKASDFGKTEEGIWINNILPF